MDVSLGLDRFKDRIGERYAFEIGSDGLVYNTV
jgi:hypothetical protein